MGPLYEIELNLGLFSLSLRLRSHFGAVEKDDSGKKKKVFHRFAFNDPHTISRCASDCESSAENWVLTRETNKHV